ncbi:MAG: type II secretion system protein [Candidatus Nealsonbacteria bacterium]
MNFLIKRKKCLHNIIFQENNLIFEKRKKNSAGFTVIELLLVIAIIGLLSAIALISLIDAKNKTRDTKIDTSISQIRVQAQVWYNDHNDSGNYYYDGFCGDDNVDILETEIILQNGGILPNCYAGSDDYCFSALYTNGITYICIDETGRFDNIQCNDSNDCN